MKLLSFVIPCYRSELTIQSVIDEIRDVMNEKHSSYAYEIILVNDCSPENVLSKINSLAEQDERIKVIDLAQNVGKHAAVLCGYRYAKGDLIVNLDDDFQCPVYELWSLVRCVEDGADVAMAKYKEKKQSLFKNFGSAINARMAEKMIGKPKEMHFENFSVMKKYIADQMALYSNPYPYLEGLMLSVTKNICNVEVEERERGDSLETGFTFSKSLQLFLNGFTAFSVIPLRIASIMGVIIACIGAIFAIIIVVSKLSGEINVPGYSSIIATILVMGGMIMLLLGIVGEYVGRIYICLNGIPQYVVKETKNLEL